MQDVSYRIFMTLTSDVRENEDAIQSRDLKLYLTDLKTAIILHASYLRFFVGLRIPNLSSKIPSNPAATNKGKR
jgi:hypothetical protein